MHVGFQSYRNANADPKGLVWVLEQENSSRGPEGPEGRIFLFQNPNQTFGACISIAIALKTYMHNKMRRGVLIRALAYGHTRIDVKGVA